MVTRSLARLLLAALLPARRYAIDWHRDEQLRQAAITYHGGHQ